MNGKHDELTVVYMDTQNVKNPVSTFKVSGVHKGIRVNQVVSLTPHEVARHFKERVDILAFLKEIDKMRENDGEGPCRQLLVNKAYERAASAYKTLQTYRLMLSLSQKDRQGPKKTVSVYDRKGRVTQYDANGRPVSTLKKGRLV